ncbi:MAG: sigma-70 family RNA polymerase sigma factor [Synechococcaceae cyanobacterium]|nr:sigma-70 family RNA polymerase sigma factor [Synechococcaceae cyanobacterium]
MPAPTKLFSGSSDALSQHLRAIGRIPLLRPEEEITLGRAVQDLRRLEEAAEELTLRSGGSPPCLEAWGAAVKLTPAALRRRLRQGQRARERMVAANLRLVVTIARKYIHSQLELDDLIQEGNLGLIRAVDRFDPTRGYRFSTYAYWWIREGISRAITDRSRTIRLPAQVSESLGKLRRAQQELLQRLGRTPSLEDLAEATGLKPLDIRELLFRAQQPLSLDATPIGESDGNLMDKVRCESLSPDDRLAVRSLREDLEALLGSLPNPESQLLRLRYGIQQPEPMSLSAVARQMGVTRDTARGIERRAVAAVRDQSRGVEAYLVA